MTLQRITVVASLVAVAVWAHLFVGTRVAQSGNEPDPEQLVEDLIAAVSKPRDTDTVATLVADDVVITDIGRDSFAVIGEPAFVGILAAEEEEGFEEEVSILSAEVDGNVVSGRIETSSTETEEAGVTRYRQFFEVTIDDDGLISRIDLTYDESDAQTREFLDFRDEGEDDGGGEVPDGTVEVPLTAQPAGDQAGSAFIFPGAAPGTAFVVIQIQPGPDDVLQPAHFHTGTCTAPGPVVYPLASVLDGDSFTALSASVGEVTAQDLIINVHRSEAKVTEYVSCGDVRGSGAAPTAVPAVTPTQTPVGGIVAPNTGMGSSGGRTLGWAVVALMVVGFTTLMASVAIRLRTR